MAQPFLMGRLQGEGGQDTVVGVLRYGVTMSRLVLLRACGGLSGSLEDFGDVSVCAHSSPDKP